MSVRDTSVEAYNQIRSSGVLSEKRWVIYDCLYKHGPLTANAIFRRIIGRSGINQANVPARLNELVKMGAVKEVGKVTCDITGMTVIAFDVTSAIPGKLSTKPTKRQARDQIIKELREFCQGQKLTIEQVKALKPIADKIKNI